MPNIEVKHLFETKRFPENDLKIIALILYLPLGIAIFLLRAIFIICVVLVGSTLSDTWFIHKLVNKVASIGLGVMVSVENPEKKENVELYISNSISIFDHLAAHSVTGSVTPGNKMHPALSQGLGIHHFGSASNLESFKNNIAKLINEQRTPVLLSPEDKITNGTALIKFKTYPFSLTTKVQPLCIRIERPLLDISMSTVGSNYWTDVFFYMFSPVTIYKLKFLPILEKKTLPDAEFAEIVRQNIATELKIETCDLSSADLLEWEKRQVADQQQQRAPPQRPAGPDNEVRRMALQVKEVLPHVPLAVIQRDLNKTRSIDSTITNILEGRLQFVPEEPSTTPSGASSASSGGSGPSGSPGTADFNTAASTFSKNANERNQSFQERKEHLIAIARKRYIEKHQLDLPH